MKGVPESEWEEGELGEKNSAKRASTMDVRFHAIGTLGARVKQTNLRSSRSQG